MNIFQSVKKSVTARQAAERYGLKVNTNGMACCPFHQDRHPSMKVDQGFYCFACGAKGDVITFTGKLFGMSPYEAAKKLITDFNLPIPLKEQKSVQNKSRDREGKKVQSRYHFSVKSKVRTWKNHAVEVLTNYLSWIRFWKQFYGSGPEPFEQEMLTPEEIRDNLEVTEKGRIRQSIQNCKYVLEYDPCLRGAVCRNEMTCQIDIKKKVPWKRRGVQMTDTDMNNLSLYLEKNYGLTSDRVIGKAIDIVANDNSFHPIIDLLESLKWDGRPRIAGMLTHFFGAENPEYAGEVMKMHMLAAISRLYEPGKKYDIMLCLVGGQGTGKSTFFKYLAIQDEWFTDDVKRLDDKKVYEYLQGHWIVEMSEMNAVANAKSIEETKSFLSRQKDTYRIPYERRAEDRYRQGVFCGTSNDLAFLPFDRTGNRRFGPVKVCPEKAETMIYRDEKGSREYIIQAWAEAMEIYRSREFLLTFSPDMEDYVKSLQKDFMPEDTQTGMIQAFLDNYEEDYVCSTIIYQEVFHQEGIVPKWQSKEIGDLMDNEITGWEKHGNHRFSGGLGTQRSWKRIRPKKDSDGFMKVDENKELPFE